MATKSRVRKKNGNPVKYKPKPKGLSKTKMKKLLQMIEDQQKNSAENQAGTTEIREGGGELLISPDFIKKLNVSSSVLIDNGPELAEDSKHNITGDTDEIPEVSETPEQNNEEEEGPISSEI
jgi:hypothetical protein